MRTILSLMTSCALAVVFSSTASGQGSDALRPNFVWNVLLKGHSNSHIFDMDVGPNGSIALVGRFLGSESFDPLAPASVRTSHGEGDGFIAVYNGEGRLAWVGTIGGAQNDEAFAVRFDRSGSIYVAGAFWGAADFDPGPGQDMRTSFGDTPDFFISRYSTTGSYLGTKIIGGPDYEGHRLAYDTAHKKSISLAIDFDGTLVFVGNVRGPTPSLAWSTVIKRFDPQTFNEKASWKITGTIVNDLKLDASGNMVFGGLLFGEAVLSPTGAPRVFQSSPEWYSPFVLKVTRDGRFLWAKTMNVAVTFDFNYARPLPSVNDIAIDSCGNIIVVGNFEGTIGFDGFASLSTRSADPWIRDGDEEDIFIAKIMADGSYQWVKAIKSVLPESDYWMHYLGTNRALSVAVDQYDTIYLTGHYNKSVDFDPGDMTDLHTATDYWGEPGYEPEFFVSKFSPNGAYWWTQEITGPNDVGVLVRLSPDRKVVLAGAVLYPPALLLAALAPQGGPGDFNADGSLNLQDVSSIPGFAKCYADQVLHHLPLARECQPGDCNQNGQIDKTDKMLMEVRIGTSANSCRPAVCPRATPTPGPSDVSPTPTLPAEAAD